MVKPPPIASLAASLLAILQVGCTQTVSKIIVAQSALSHRGSDLTTVRRVCVEVAEQHGLKTHPMKGDTSDATWFGRPIGGLFNDFGGPSFVVASAQPPDLAVVVVSGDATSDPTAIRRELATDITAALQNHFGARRVKAYEQQWTDF
jgi:hypothetical protein